MGARHARDCGPKGRCDKKALHRFATSARDLVANESADGCLQTGVYETGRNRFTVDQPYPHDEFMYFLKGGVSLRSTDGSVTEVAAGDGVLLPKGWTGVWDSAGYRKIYVIYDCKKAQ